MSAIRIGTTGGIAQPSAYSFNPASGQVITTETVFDTFATAAASFNAAVSSNIETQLTPLPGGRWQVIQSYPSGIQNTWELDIQWNDRVCTQSDKFHAWFATLESNSDRAQFMNICELIRNGDPGGDGVAILDAMDDTYQAWAWDSINDVPVREPSAVLRRTITWPAGDSSTTVDWTDVNKVWTTLQITSQVNPPAAICGVLPQAYWLMLSQQAEYGPDGRFTASTIWISGTYPTHRYTYKTGWLTIVTPEI